MAKTGRRTVW